MHGRNIGTTTIAGTEIDYIKDDPSIADRFESCWDEAELFRRIKDVSDEEVATFGGIFWDIGACVGVHSSFASNFYEKVVAFEPVGANMGALMDNISITGRSDVISTDGLALSDKSGETEIAIRESSLPGYGRHSISVGDDDDSVIRTETVTAKKGDDIALGQGYIPTVIKIDVEGAEGQVLEGMENILNSTVCRHVFVETHAPDGNDAQPTYEDFGYTIGEIYDLLLDAGFSIEYAGKSWMIHASK